MPLSLFFGNLQKLYREKTMKFMINGKENLVNHLIHVFHIDLDSFILYSDMNSIDDES